MSDDANRRNHKVIDSLTCIFTTDLMPGWTLVDNHTSHGRIFERPLDHAEVAFALDARIKGTTDAGQYFRLRLLNGSQDAHLFSNHNIIKAWLSTKRRFPLAGATIRGPEIEGDSDSAGSDPHLRSAFQAHFTVRERDLAVVRPNEIIFGQVATAEDVQDQIVATFDGPRVLSEDMLVQLRILREIDPQKADTLHVMMFIAHSVSDATAIQTLTSCFLDTLARGGGSESEPAQMSLEERLAMAVSFADLLSKHMRFLSAARRRWRMAIGYVIFMCRMRKYRGGHTLPCRITHSTPITPARTGNASVSFTDAQTTSVLANCRLHNLTFGNAYLPLAQVAMTRVLYRRYLRGEISEEEWEYRKRQPYLTLGPFSMRSRLDKEWFNRGGGGEFVLSLSTFFYSLPFMTLGTTTARSDRCHIFSDGAPPFSDLLTFDRFLHRTGLVTKQANALFRHPFFLEIVHATNVGHAVVARLGVMQWMDGKDKTSKDDVLAVSDLFLAFAHGGSSRGNVDLASQTEYPLPPTHPLSPYAPISRPVRAGYINPPTQLPPHVEITTTPKVVVENSTSPMLCTRPGELYLGATSSHGRLGMNIYYDRNVFEEEVVKEWLDEVKAAVLWYLGRTHRSSRAPRGRVDGDGRPDSRRGPAKL